MSETLSPREILARLVAFPTVSDSSNLALIDWVEGYLNGWGVTCHRVPNAEGTKSSLYAVIGPSVPGGIALSGHSDVVPVEGQAWSSDPFTLTERAGRLYGRGAADMKGFVALMLAAVPLAVQARLRRPLYLALSYDEEVGCEGCIGMVAEMAQRLPAPAGVIVGEPTRLQVVNGHKGSLALKVLFTGHEVHASLAPYGVNANMEAGRLIAWANEVNATNAAGVPGVAAQAFDPPWTTVQVGRIHGGTADNITAGSCWLTLAFRVIPGETVEDWDTRTHAAVDRIRAGMKAVHPSADVTVTRLYQVPLLAPEPAGGAEALATELTGQNGALAVSFATEAGHFQHYGWSTVVCGPGDIVQAHTPDEYIETAQLDDGYAFIERIVAWLQA
ncbi:MAG TPA: acetylornithine deacetylase [Paenirhodobacter sp.]